MIHLMFADDLVVFSAADPRTVQLIEEAFGKFSRSTGLEANKSKSQVVMGGCRADQMQMINDITGFQKEHCPLGTSGYLSL